jgi:DNA-binding transcriptional MerR regulator
MNFDKRLLSIGEVAKSINVTRRIILNYEAQGLLRPDVKEGGAGNRYYTPDTLTRIRTIRVLQDLGLSLCDIRAYLDEDTDLHPIIARMEALRDELNLSIEKLRARLNTGEPPLIEQLLLPEQLVYRRVFRAVTVAEKKEHLRIVIPDAMRAYGSDTTRRMYFIEFPLDDPQEVAYCISVPGGSVGEYVCHQPETPALSLIHHGGYETLPAVRARMRAWAAEQGIALAGTCRHIYLEGPPQHKDPQKYITQVALPLLPPDEPQA